MHFHYIGNFGSGIEQGLNQRFGGEAAVQAFALEGVLGLVGGVKLFVFHNLAGAVAGGEMLTRQHLPRRRQGADQDALSVGGLRFGGRLYCRC